VVGLIQGFRWAILGGMTFPGVLILESVLVSFVLLWSGAMYFRRMERSFADIV
jgi:lipopolysaccharide transport system permease protein